MQYTTAGLNKLPRIGSLHDYWVKFNSETRFELLSARGIWWCNYIVRSETHFPDFCKLTLNSQNDAKTASTDQMVGLSVFYASNYVQEQLMTPCPRRTPTELALMGGQHHEAKGRRPGRPSCGSDGGLGAMATVHSPPTQWSTSIVVVSNGSPLRCLRRDMATA